MDKISFCVVALNAEKTIGSLFSDLLRQTYPKEKTEVILVDGMSEDSTKTIMLEFKAKWGPFYAGISVLDNPGKILPCGWNTALRQYSGEAIVRVDAHASVEPDFLEKNVRILENGEEICGGKVTSVPADDSFWSAMLNLAENSLFGGSIAKFRHADEPGYADTLAYAMYKRKVFDKVGLYNEKLVRTEDNEMHYRMRKAGCKFYFDPKISSTRKTRDSLRALLSQKYGNGFWIGKTVRVCPGCFSFYHFVPLCFVLGILITAIAGCIWSWIPAAVMWILYAVAAVSVSIVSTAVSKSHVTGCIILPFLFLVLHVGYGVGTIAGLVSGD